MEGRCVIDRLLTEGSYALILNRCGGGRSSFLPLTRILLFLDGRSIARAAKVSSLWRRFVVSQAQRHNRLKQVLEERLDRNWKNHSVTKMDLHLRDVLVNFQEKVCSASSRQETQLLVLGKGYAGPGQRLLVTRGELERPLLLAPGEGVLAAALGEGRQGDMAAASIEVREAEGPAVAIRVEGESVYLLGRDWAVWTLHLPLRRLVLRVPARAGGRVTAMDVSHGLLVTGCSDRRMEVWSLAEGALVRRLELGQPVAVVAVARPLVAAGGGWVAVWRARDGALLHRLETRGAAISRIGLAGDRLLAGDVRGNLLLWDRRPGDRVKETPPWRAWWCWGTPCGASTSTPEASPPSPTAAR